eukprot:756755-Hanusia_phi.AAC.2
MHTRYVVSLQPIIPSCLPSHRQPDTKVSSCPVASSSREQLHPMIPLDPRNNMRAGGESQSVAAVRL